MTFTSRTGTSLSQFEYWHKPQTILILFQNVKVPIFRAYEAVQISFENTLKTQSIIIGFIPSSPHSIYQTESQRFQQTYFHLHTSEVKGGKRGTIIWKQKLNGEPNLKHTHL